jgi:hypothetical protein
MLSDDLAAIAERLVRYEHTGVDLHPVAVTAAVAVFRDLAAQARALESRPVPPGARGELPPGVARLDAARARRSVA